MRNSRARLGELLIDSGLVTPEALARALDEQTRSKRRLGALLVDQGVVSAQQLTQMLSHQLTLPWVELERSQPSPELLSRVPRELAVRHRMIPVYLRASAHGDTLYVATDDPTNADGLQECSEHAGVPIRAMVAAPDSVSRALAQHYGAALSILPEPVTPQPCGAVRLAAAPKPPPRVAPPPPARPAPKTLAEVEELADDAVKESKDSPVLVVNAPQRFYDECAKAAQALGVPVRGATLGEVAELSKQLEPLAMVVSEDVYAFDRVALNRLALEVGAPLVIWSDDLEAEFLEPVLRTAQQRK